MNTGIPLFGSFGQRQDLSGTVVLHVPFRAASPELGERELEAGVNALPSRSTIDELSKFHESNKAQTLAWVAKVLSRTNQLDFLFLRQLEFPSGEIQSAITEPERPITFVARSAKASPYRGRITGPVKFVNQLLATWNLEPQSACTLLGFEPSQFSYVHGVLQGHETLTGRDARDRIVHLFQIRKLLSALFQNETVENEWLREPHDTLNGKKPMDLLLEGSMENLLLVREYVELVAGR